MLNKAKFKLRKTFVDVILVVKKTKWNHLSWNKKPQNLKSKYDETIEKSELH